MIKELLLLLLLQYAARRRDLRDTSVMKVPLSTFEYGMCAIWYQP